LEGGETWIFQDKVLELSQAAGRRVCPTVANKEPDGEKDANSSASVCQNADHGNDDGEGHQFVMTIDRNTYLYSLDRATGHIDSDQMVIHPLNPAARHPLNGAPADDVATDTTPAFSPAPQTTSGRLTPTAFLEQFPIPTRWRSWRLSDNRQSRSALVQAN
jgi:hypothetical protein